MERVGRGVEIVFFFSCRLFSWGKSIGEAGEVGEVGIDR